MIIYLILWIVFEVRTEENCSCAMSDEKGPQNVYGHVAVRLEDHILVFGGVFGNNFDNITPASYAMIWMYNLYTEQWSKQTIPESVICPPSLFRACAVAIKENVFLFGGVNLLNGSFSNDLWNLCKSAEGLFTWCKVVTENLKLPSPRVTHSGWTYLGKMWIFGGYGPSIDRYLNDNGEFEQGRGDNGFNNQLLTFSPSCNEWINLECIGSIPPPCVSHASATIGEIVWLYGGCNAAIVFDDLYELNMSSLRWTHVQIGGTIPPGRTQCSLNAVTHYQLLLHGGSGSENKPLSDTWILDLKSHTWRRYKSGDDYPRQRHTGSTGINSNSIIIGGVIHPDESNDDIQASFHIMLEPRSLQQLAMQTIYTHHNSLPWEYLPKKLIALLGITTNKE